MTDDPSLLSLCPVVPVVVLDDPGQARSLGQALLAGGITVAEITLRTAAGLESIRLLRDLPGLTTGAGSVLLPEQVDQVYEAGARFVVSPGLAVAVVQRCRDLGLPTLPGIATGSELMSAVALGLSEVKFFPAGLLGGPAAIASMSAPFPGISFLPSGGVSAATMTDYLDLPCVPAISGSWMVAPALIRDGRWEEITRLSAEAMARATGAPTRPR